MYCRCWIENLYARTFRVVNSISVIYFHELLPTSIFTFLDLLVLCLGKIDENIRKLDKWLSHKNEAKLYIYIYPFIKIYISILLIGRIVIIKIMRLQFDLVQVHLVVRVHLQHLNLIIERRNFDREIFI